ncbi:MAG: hypothetical protein AAFQ37_07065 [Bacteroidota bacterium]
MKVLKEYIESSLTPVQQSALQSHMRWTDYQWTWHINHPDRWTHLEIVALVAFTGIDYDTWTNEYGLGKKNSATA